MTVPAPLPQIGSPTATQPSAARIGREADAREAAKHFEGMFLSTLLNTMFSKVDAGIFGGGPSEKIYRSMFVDEVAKSVAQGGGLGIADHIYTEILKTQEIGR